MAKNPDTISDADILARLESKAVHYLGRYASTRTRLGQVLDRFARRKMPQIPKERMVALIARKVEECAARGYVNDALYAEVKTASLRRAGGARMAIAGKLRMAGVAPDTIEAALGSDADGVAEKTAALAYARRRRLGAFAGARKREAEDWQTRHIASLARAGFGYEVARFVLDFPTPADAENWLAENRLADKSLANDGGNA